MVTEPTAGKSPAMQPAFFSRTIDEALALTQEARDYLTEYSTSDRSGLSQVEQVKYSLETMRLTTRLTYAMAWLLAQRAAHQGELSYEELRDKEWRLGGHKICLHDPVLSEELPTYFRDLVRRSLAFYQRIQRLDEMVAKG
jgi:regulator of CtrA degradation